MPEVFGVMLGEGEETFRRLAETLCEAKRGRGIVQDSRDMFPGKRGNRKFRLSGSPGYGPDGIPL